MRIIYFSANVAGATMSRRMKWVGYAARIGQIGDSKYNRIWYINDTK